MDIDLNISTPCPWQRHGPLCFTHPVMPSTARHQIIKPDEVTSYHLTARCVRRAFLCGEDIVSGKNYDHRREIIENRLRYVLKNVFWIDLTSYALMSNHFHSVIRIRPDLARTASDEEVVQRWWNLYPRKIKGEYLKSPPDILKLQWLSDPEWLHVRRKRLCSMSWFMSSICEDIARKANKEDGVTGRFWEGRFKSQILLDEKAVLSAATYVDLNPIRANVTDQLEDSNFTSIQRRIRDFLSSEKQSNYCHLDFLEKFSSTYSILKRETPSLAIDPKDYIAICAWKASQVMGENSEAAQKVYLETMKRLDIPEEEIDWTILRRSKYAVGPKSKVIEFAAKRNVRFPHFVT